MNTFIELFRKELLEIACLKDNTVGIYLQALYAYADYAKSVLRINLVDSKARHLHKWLYCLKTKNKGYNFIKDSKVALNKFFAFLVKAGYRESNPADKLPRVKVPKSTLNKPLATHTLVKLLNSCNRTKWMGMRNFTIIALLWALGLRVNELRAIKRRDIDLDYDPGNRTGTLLVHGKGGKERTLFIVDDLFDTLFHYLSLKKTPKRLNSLIFPCSKGPVIGSSRVRQMIMETALKAGITSRVTPHVFRHTFATDMYSRGVPVEAIKDMMGHESIRETSVYVHITDELQAMALNKLSVKERV
jgi:site-specific recombinase XerD